MHAQGNLRYRLVKAKNDVKQAQIANALAEDAGKPAPHDDAAMADLRAAVDAAARAAREAGVDISDLVGPGVGRLD